MAITGVAAVAACADTTQAVKEGSNSIELEFRIDIHPLDRANKSHLIIGEQPGMRFAARTSRYAAEMQFSSGYHVLDEVHFQGAEICECVPLCR